MHGCEVIPIKRQRAATATATAIGDIAMGLKIGSVPSTSSASTVYELLSRASAANPTGTAITYLEDADTLSVTRLTHAEFIERLYQMAHLFRELGVGRHDVVSIFSPSVTDALVAFFAAETVGIANPINFLLRSDEVEAMMRAVGSKVLVTLGPESPDLWSKVEHMQKLVPSLAQIVTIGAASGDAISLRTALRGRPTAPPSSDLLSAAEDVAAYFYTGGTTGFPKVAQLLHRNQAFSAEALADSWQFGSTTRALNGLPTFHVAGALLLGLTPLGRGGEVILPTVTGFRNPRVIANYWRLVEGLKVTIGGGTPTTLASLLDVPIGNADISSLKFFMTGGTHMPAAIAKSLKERCSIEVRQLYGMTETAGFIAACRHSGVPDPHSIGEVVAGAQIEARELQGDGSVGGPVVEGKPGALVTKGPHVFPGYLFNGDKSGPFTGDGWFITGNIGFCGPDGRLVVTGRAKDVIIRSEHNIDPTVIEEVAGKCTGVGIAAVVGMPDAYAGEVPVVYLTVATGSSVSSESLIAQLTENVPEPPARPRQVFILEQMPTTAAQKTDKAALRRDATRRAVHAALEPLSSLDGESTDVVVRRRRRPIDGHYPYISNPSRTVCVDTIHLRSAGSLRICA
jgi:fatty-acyl-CoA synthase